MRTVRHLEGSWRSHVTTRLITLLSTAMLKTKAFVLVECSPDSEGLRLTGVITRNSIHGEESGLRPKHSLHSSFEKV